MSREDHTPDEFGDIERRLRSHRDEPTELDLDRIKLRAMDRAAGAPQRGPVGRLVAVWRAQGAALVVALGLMLSTSAAGVMASNSGKGGSGKGDDKGNHGKPPKHNGGKHQYCPPKHKPGHKNKDGDSDCNNGGGNDSDRDSDSSSDDSDSRGGHHHDGGGHDDSDSD